MKYKNLYFFLLMLLFSFSYVSAQVTFQSDTGSVSGFVLNTDDFAKNVAIPQPKERIMENDFETSQPPRILPNINQPVNSFYVEDKNLGIQAPGGLENPPIMLDQFPGIPMTNYIPPDPNVAVGPNHIVAVVNSRFTIWDKQGNLLKSINADDWFSQLYSNPIAGDPQIIYDHYANRWVMVWHRASSGPPSFLYTAVSDDENPLGVWYAWATPGDYNGHNYSNLFADYPHVGYDSQAIYITSNQFQWGGYLQYARIRIISKADLYSSAGGALHFTDLWNISLPGSSGKVAHISPTVTSGNTSDYYLISAPSNGGNALALYKISNAVTSPTITGTNVFVSTYYPPPNANQLGGGDPLISSNGAQIQERSYFKNDTLWAVHAIRNPNQTSHSAISFYKINVNTSSVIDDITLGSPGYYYVFPALIVDKDGNVCLTYSRSSETEYIGAFYSVLKNGDPNAFSGSIPLKAGLGNYVVTYGGDRNRWGDYMGIYLDPVDQNKFWVFTEYASGTNTWGTWVGGIRTVPFNGPNLNSMTDSLDFHNIEVGNVGDTLSIGMGNYGSEDVVITDIPVDLGPFHMVNDITFPITLSTYDSLTIKYVFHPTEPGPYRETVTINSNSPGFQDIILKGRGYEINPAVVDNFYAVSGSVNEGSLFTINTLTGAGVLIGNADYDDIDVFKSLTIDPHTGLMYGVSNIDGNSIISRINSSLGDAYAMYNLPITNIYSITFDSSGTLYGIQKSGGIYTINLGTGSYTFLDSIDVMINSAAFDLVTNTLYATAFVAIGSNKDRIYTIDPETGVSTIIGNTGFNILTNDLAFDPAGNMYGVIGSASQDNNFISIDKNTGTGTIIGSVNYPNITGLAYSYAGITGIEHSGNPQMPKDYVLKQNYPNPFNPSTRIEYTLPVTAGVKVVIYNLLGEVVNVLVNSQQNAGNHSVVWNSEDMHGNKVGSGVYFYELKANGMNGSDFTQIRKMILLK